MTKRQGRGWLSALLLLSSPVRSQPPSIQLTHLPKAGTSENITGRVRGLEPSAVRLQAFIRVDGGWWTKPYFDRPFTRPWRDGAFEIDVTTGGRDAYFDALVVIAVGDQAKPVLLSGQPSVPSPVLDSALAVARVQRPVKRRIIDFAGRKWWVKASANRAGPGPNFFSDADRHVSVDAEGCLHLRLERDAAGRWQCAEVVSLESLGYGEYEFVIATPPSVLPDNATLGLFTWSDDPGPGRHHREIDVEIGKWGRADNENAQFVVQPWNRAGNMHRFEVAGSARDVVYRFRWSRDGVDFAARDAHDVGIASWSWRGEDKPEPGNENVRLNLWLVGGKAPAGGRGCEVMVRSFRFRALAPARE